MFDLTAPEMQRSKGRAAVRMHLRHGRTTLCDLMQSGAAKAMLPRRLDRDDRAAELVFLNTSGGLTGGDRLDYAIETGAGCRVLATTQTAERAYASNSGPAQVDVMLAAGPDGRIDWLPQETILFDRSHLHRTTRIELSGNATALLLETVILGRLSMGESISNLDFRDSRTISRDGRPVYCETFCLGPDSLGRRQNSAILGGANAFSTLVLVAVDASAAAPVLAPLLDEPGVEGAVSGFDGRCVVRLLAADPWSLRRQILRLLPSLLRGPLPRVWQN